MTKQHPFGGSDAFRQVEHHNLGIVAEISEDELARQLGRPYRLIGGVRVPWDGALADGAVSATPDADDKQILDPVQEIEPEEPAAKLDFWRRRAVWAPDAYTYEQAQAHVLALTGRADTAWEQDVLDRTIASIARGERQASEPRQVHPEGQMVEQQAKTVKITYRKIVDRDLQTGDIGTVVSWEEAVPVGEDGKPMLPPRVPPPVT